MRALVFDRKLEFRGDYPDPVAAPGESIVRVTVAGICGTDLEIARGYMQYRGVPGHEFAGRVVESQNSALRGKRVVGEINAGCGRCATCFAGDRAPLSESHRARNPRPRRRFRGISSPARPQPDSDSRFDRRRRRGVRRAARGGVRNLRADSPGAQSNDRGAGRRPARRDGRARAQGREVSADRCGTSSGEARAAG